MLVCNSVFVCFVRKVKIPGKARRKIFQMHTKAGSFTNLILLLISHEYFCVTNCFHYLIFMAWALAILGQAFQSLVDQHYILFIDVEAQEAQATRCTSTNAVQKLKGLTDKVVICFVVLIPQKVLKAKENISKRLKKNHCANCFQFSLYIFLPERIPMAM